MAGPDWRKAVRSRHTQQWGLVVAVAAAYTWLRWFVTPADAVGAVAHALDVVALEQQLGLYVERAWQEPILGSVALVWALNIYYIGLHLPPIAAVLVYTYKVHPRAWPYVRDVMIVFTIAGVVVHAFFPLAPPWAMQELGIQDTFADYRKDPVSQSSAGNPYAAMPSMHFGWALVAGVAFLVLARSWWLRAFGALHPLVMGFAIVVTGNHYVIDAVASTFLLILVALVAGLWHTRFKAAWAARRRTIEPT